MRSYADFHQGQRYAPGIYAWNGELHVDEAELIRSAGGNPSSERDRATARAVLRKVADSLGIPCSEVEE